MYLKQKIFYLSIGAILLAVFQVGFHLPFALTGVAFASESRAGDKGNVVAAIEQTWKDIALKNPDADRHWHPDRVWTATSEGGLRQFLSNEDFRPAIDSPISWTLSLITSTSRSSAKNRTWPTRLITWQARFSTRIAR